MNKYNLGGHSGCQIFLIENDDGDVFVRKISKNIEYNKRLKLQCEKQATFCSGLIKVPKVYSQGYTEEGLFYFDMEYIQGVTLSEHIKTMEIGKVKGLVETLVISTVPKKHINFSKEEKDLTLAVFKSKIDSLREILIDDNPIINQALNKLEKHDWSKILPSQSHGDMTLENIIIKNDSLYYIDFLDSFYNSWILDLGTLMQDIECMWSYRFQSEINMNTVLRLIVFRDLLLDEIKNIDSEYIIEIYYALLQKLIRIYPYTNDELTLNFLNEKTSVVLNTIASLEGQ